MRKLWAMGIAASVAGLTACASGGSSSVVHHSVGPGWGPWGGYYGYGGTVVIDGGGGGNVDVGPDLPAEPEFEATPLPDAQKDDAAK